MLAREGLGPHFVDIVARSWQMLVAAPRQVFHGNPRLYLRDPALEAMLVCHMNNRMTQ